MKVKFGELTINQTIKICKENHYGTCIGCKLYQEDFGCIAFATPSYTKFNDLHEKEIDLPDEEMKEDAEIH